MFLMLDNYDSFTYNLVQYLRQLDIPVEVFRNDAITTDEIAEMQPAGIVLSPGPGRPETAGVLLDTVRQFSGEIPLLGVCLGCQAIGEAFGGKVVAAGKIMHGKTSQIKHDEEGVFAKLPQPFEAMRYHSLVIEQASLPEVLIPTAHSVDDGEMMGMRHTSHPTEGVQFHPESIQTRSGKRLLRNFVNLAEKFNQCQKR